MDPTMRIEAALETAIAGAALSSGPPKLAAALHYAVFPGGARIRPKLCLAVARACGDDNPAVTDAASASIELMHCASLVHDDLPCFDNAATRRGKPSVHCTFGQPLAVLAGDALIVLAFENLVARGLSAPDRLPALISTLARSVGMPAGIVAGQAWECETQVDIAAYHQSKTGSLFAAATALGAIAAGAEPDPWRMLGAKIGEAFQVADDLHDLVSDPAVIGKPTGQDVVNERPNAMTELGFDGAAARLRQLLQDAVAAIPPCAGATELRNVILAESKKFVPTGVRLAA